MFKTFTPEVIPVLLLPNSPGHNFSYKAPVEHLTVNFHCPHQHLKFVPT